MKKKAFTLVEILIVLSIALPVMTGLFSIAVHVNNMYDEVKELTIQNGSAFDYVQDLTSLARESDHVTLADGIVVFWKDGVAFPLDQEKYNVVCAIQDDNGCIRVDIGGGATFWIKQKP